MFEEFLNILFSTVAIAFLLKLVIFIIALLLIWFFIRSAVESGTRRAIMQCYLDINDIEDEVNETILFENSEYNPEQN